GGDQDEKTGKRLEGAGDGGEREAGDEVTARRDQEREETRPDPGDIRAQQRDKARDGTTRESKHWGLGGSDTFFAFFVGTIQLTLRSNAKARRTPEVGRCSPLPCPVSPGVVARSVGSRRRLVVLTTVTRYSVCTRGACAIGGISAMRTWVNPIAGCFSRRARAFAVMIALLTASFVVAPTPAHAASGKFLGPVLSRVENATVSIGRDGGFSVPL